MKTATLGLAVAAILLLGGCGESEHTVDWYKSHMDTATEKADWCKQDAARKVQSDCQNAMEAVASVKAFGNDEHDSIDITREYKKDK